jgi:hypothetical protein
MAAIDGFLLVGLAIGMLVNRGKRVLHTYLFVFGFMFLALQIPYVPSHPVPIPELRPYVLGFVIGLLLGFASGRLGVRIQSKKIQGNRITRKKVGWTNASVVLALCIS